MPAFNTIPDFLRAVAHKEHDLRVGGDQLLLAFTNSHSASWGNIYTPSMVDAMAAVPMTFQDTVLTVTGSALNIGGDGKMDIAIADKTLVATGGPTGPFQYVYIVNGVNGKLIGFYDQGTGIAVTDGQSFILEFNDAANRAFSIS